jgi:MFS family permease
MARMMEIAVLSWFVLDITNSPLKVAFIGVARTTPMLLLSMPAGSLADRFPRERVLLTTQLLSVSVSICMLLLFLFGSVHYWFAYIAIFVTGGGWAIDFATRRPLFTDLLARDQVVNAVSLDTAVLTGSNLMGPALGGVMIFFGGFTGAYAVITMLTLIGFGAIITLRVPGRPKVSEVSIGTVTRLIQAVRLIRENRTVWVVVLVTICVNMFAIPYMQVIPVIARDILGTGSVLYGILASSVGIGGIIGSLLIASIKISHRGPIYAIGSGLMLVSLLGFAFSEVYAISLVLLFLCGVGLSAFGVMQTSMVLHDSSVELRGRAMGAVALGIGFQPLGLLIVGQLSEIFGPQLGLGILTICGLVILIALVWKYPILRHKDDRAL